jgi:hypothetical protein
MPVIKDELISTDFHLQHSEEVPQRLKPVLHNSLPQA